MARLKLSLILEMGEHKAVNMVILVNIDDEKTLDLDPRTEEDLRTKPSEETRPL